jgi:hypothetical protein
MATYYTDLSRSFGPRIGQGASRDVIAAVAPVAVTTAMIDNTNDSIGLLWVPKGAVVLRASISGTDMDTNGTPTLAFNVGDSGSATRIFSAANVGQAGTLVTAMNVGAFLYKFTADTLITAAVSTAAATGAAGTLYFSIEYYVDPEFSTTGATATTTA